MDTSALERILFDPTVGKIVALVVGFFVVRFVFGLLQRSVASQVREKNARYRVRKFINSLSYLVIVVLVTVVFSDQLGNLTVALGVAGAGIAFALQEVIASIAGWVAVSLGGFYRVGDRVQLGGIKGDVIDIGVLRTTVMEMGEWVKGDAYNGRIVRIANSFVFKEPVFNYSGDFPFLWDEIMVPVKYGGDYELARRILQTAGESIVGEYVPSVRQTWQDMMKRYLVEDASVEPSVSILVTDNWVEYTLRYVVDYKRRRSTKDRLFLRILEEFDKTEGRVTVASTTVHLVETPVLDIRMRGQTASA